MQASTELSLMEQMRITEFEIKYRKELLAFTDEDALILAGLKSIIELEIDLIVEEFYKRQTAVPDIALLIGDADTLRRLQHAQRKYILDLFRGTYDMEYVNNILRIGLVHKRIGVEPKLYLSAVYLLKSLLIRTLAGKINDSVVMQNACTALDKILYFDVTLVFETYIRSLMQEVKLAKDKAEQYATNLEQTVRERTFQLEELSRIDPLTGIYNRRYLIEILTRILRSSQRRSEPVTLIYFDVDNFKQLNDIQGHQYGDDVLSAIGRSLISISRNEDCNFRYGGDEFCIVLPNCTEAEVREKFCQRLRNSLSQQLKDVTLSIGVYQTGPDEYVDAENMIKLADDNMYKVKKKLKTQEA